MSTDPEVPLSATISIDRETVIFSSRNAKEKVDTQHPIGVNFSVNAVHSGVHRVLSTHRDASLQRHPDRRA
jgi:hypothetical protein